MPVLDVNLVAESPEVNDLPPPDLLTVPAPCTTDLFVGAVCPPCEPPVLTLTWPLVVVNVYRASAITGSCPMTPLKAPLS